MEEVSLLVGGQVFKVKKNVLCEHSDYFRAMFSGNYVENQQQEIAINVVDAKSMEIIIRYMNIGLIDLSEIPLSTIGELAIAANFLQIIELIKQIEYCLDLQLSISNWVETMTIAENSSYSKLEQLAAAFGLLSFKDMKPKYIPTIHKLFWYLSHTHLDTDSELDVFKFGHQWISHTETGADALIIVLGCLDIRKLTIHDIKEIKSLISDYINSLAAKVVDCIHDLLVDGHIISTALLTERKLSICQTFTERVYNEVFNLVRESKERTLMFTPTVPMWTVKNTKPEVIPHHMYTFDVENGFDKWIEVSEKNLWGWNVAAWGPTRIVVVCGEYGRGTGAFMKDVKVYDTLREEWTRHGVELPPRRHGGVAIVGDSMFVTGGVGGFRVVLDTAIIYNLKERTFRPIAKLPDTIQIPATCTHEDKVYAAGHKNIYRYEDHGETDSWNTVIGTDIRMSCMISFKGYIYCTQNYFSHLYRFRPDVDSQFDLINYFRNPPAAICNLRNRLIVFTRTMCGQSDILSVEEYFGDNEESPKVLWTKSESVIKVNDVAGSCTLVMNIPPLNKDVSPYHKRYLLRYTD